MKLNWKSYFIFSEKELKAVVVVGAFILVSTAFALLFPTNKKNIHLVKFDPNTLDSIAAIQLGFTPKQFLTLSNYRKKGGKFYKATDIYKWYGVKKNMLDQVYPFVQINNHLKLNHHHFIKTKKSTLLDINLASVSDLEKILNNQPTLAARIIKYRSYLGGFATLGQLRKVYGMKETTFKYLSPYLTLKKGVKTKMQRATINYHHLVQLGIFEQRVIWQILNSRKEKGHIMGWSEIVVQFDLSREQAILLKVRTDIQ